MHFFEDNVADDSDGFWDDMHQHCVDASDEVGAAVDWMYDTIAGRGLPDDVADNIGDEAGDFVEEHWPDVCDLPENIADSFDDSSADGS